MQGITRRKALSMLAGAGVLPRAARAAADQSVAVIGAGLAGLAAAQALTTAGLQVTVFEARSRIGGRIWTSRAWPGLPMDLGASWIHGVTGNPVTALADAAGAKRVVTRYASALALDARGKVFDDPLLGKATQLVAAARRAANGLDQDVSLAAAVRRSPGWVKAGAPLRKAVRRYVNDTVEQEYGGAWDEVSSWSFDDGTEFPGNDVLFPDGYDQIPRAMAQGLDVRLGQRLTALDPMAGGVRLTFAGGATARFDRVILTVPLGVLQAGAIRFGAPLAPARQRAINGLRMGLLNKCWLRFDKIAWPDDVDWITWAGPRDGFWAQWVSLAAAAQAPVLLAFHAGAQARSLEKLSDKAMRGEAHNALKAMFGARFPAPLGAQVTRWSQDELTRGSYSFNAVGTDHATRQALAGTEWDGRLAFAGEATAAMHFGTAHGAVLSGRAAAQVIAGG